MKKISSFLLGTGLLIILSACTEKAAEFFKTAQPTPQAEQQPITTPESEAPAAFSDAGVKVLPPESITKKEEPKAEIKPQSVTLDSGNLYFKPGLLTVKVNRPVTVNYTNKGGHTFTVDELGVNERLTASSGSFTFTPKKAGTFVMYCSIPGHYQAGMKGTITVIQ